MAALAIPATSAYAQYESANGSSDLGPTMSQYEIAPGVTPHNVTSSPEALWDIQFGYDATATSGTGGFAGVCFFNNEFWVSRWASDSLFRYSQSGTLLSRFTIPGLTGVRALTTDGIMLYAATNTTTIYRIDPATSLLAPPHTVVAAGSPGNVRHCSFDPALNGGAGGFYVGNFNTDIWAVSRTGAILSTIPAATHGQTGMYGSGFDNLTAGGPYLWVFAQSGANNSQITRIQLPGGTPTVISHDVMSDVGPANGLTSGLAGGMFISDQIVTGQWTICGMIQGTPNNILFGYELSDPVILSYDAKMETLRSTEGYTRIPVGQVFPETFDATFSNNGSQTLASVNIDYTVSFGGSSVFTNTQTVSNVASGASASTTSAPFTPSSGVGTYEVLAVARLGGGQTDSLPGNDSLMWSFQVTDTTYARDNDVPDGGAGYNVGTTESCFITANYTLYAPDTLSSIWIELATPITGDTTFGVVAGTIANFPDVILATGSINLIDAATNTYVLMFPGGLPLNSGTYSFGAYQTTNSALNLAQSNDVWTADVNYFYIPSVLWNASGVPTARFIRPNFGTAVGVSNRTPGNVFVELYPNPTNGKFQVLFADGFSDVAHVTVTNAMGQVVRNVELNPTTARTLSLDMAGEAAGMYFVHVDNGSDAVVKKMMVRN
jgi:Secretion system C-terminal sorting domain